jgi:anaerobic magnesium-protoporphyrin IX monomethyl ester cyclase
LPGTVFYEKVRNELHEKTNWTDSDELALMFKNTYPPAFYKQLHRFVQQNYRKHLVLENIKNLLKHPGQITYKAIKKAMSAGYYVPAAFYSKLRLDALAKTE